MDIIICPHDEWSFALVRRTFCLHGMAACALCRQPLILDIGPQSEADLKGAPVADPHRSAGGLDRLSHLPALHAAARQGLRHVPHQPQARCVGLR